MDAATTHQASIMRPVSAEEHRRLVLPRPWLWWDVGDTTRLSVSSVVERILKYGDWPDFLEAIDVLGLHTIRDAFFHHIKSPRCDYRPQTKNLFIKYFERYA